jgi:hypothetical protein
MRWTAHVSLSETSEMQVIQACSGKSLRHGTVGVSMGAVKAFQRHVYRLNRYEFGIIY